MDLEEKNPNTQPVKKRKQRPQLSCVICRQKKLKCNRLYPCNNCIKQNRIHICHYAGPSAMSRDQSRGIQDHIRKLEVHIGQLSTKSGNAVSSEDPASSVPTGEPQTGPKNNYPGTMSIHNDGTQYTDPTHWEGVLNEIAEVKEYLEMVEETSPEDDTEDEATTLDIPGPVLLFGNTLSSTKFNLLSALPSRSLADRLVSAYLNSQESPLVLIHVPTFSKEYAVFWRAPEDTTLNWLAWLYIILCGGAGLQLFSASGRANGEYAQAFAEYHRLSSQCLTMINYTSPGRYKMETMITSVAMEILRSPDNHLGSSVMIGLATRLAIHGGFHRDSKHYPSISAFDGEMRRRIWSYIFLLDHYISLQAGLPPSTSQIASDTENPRNLTDEDLDPSATTLPPSRPLTEKTLVLYPTVLNEIMFYDAEIIRKVGSVKGVPYSKVLQFDKKLKEFYAAIPSPFKFRPPDESIGDSPNTKMDRYNIDLMYQKARCDLHRRYLGENRLDPTYANSRRECLDAARTVLQHQSDIFDTYSSAGEFTSFFFAPIVSVHFRSAAMLVSLEISCQSRYDLKQNLPLDVRQSILAERKQLSQELERACAIWEQLRHQSKEASKTAQALHIMVKVANNHLQHGATPEKSHGTDFPTDGSHSMETSEYPRQPHSSIESSLLKMSLTPDTTNPISSLAQTPDSQSFQGPLPSDTNSWGVDLMDASFYLGQDIVNEPRYGQFAGSTHAADFYERYWDNLMLLGNEEPFPGVDPGM